MFGKILQIYDQIIISVYVLIINLRSAILREDGVSIGPGVEGFLQLDNKKNIESVADT